MTDFTRARRPEQISQRRQAILAAAAALFDAEGPAGAGLNAIAARAGFTKSNVYRYFESREDVLLALFLDAHADLCAELCEAYAALAPGDVAGLSAATARAFGARRRLCDLMSIFSTVLEQNVSAATVEAVKARLKALTGPVVAGLSDRLPGTSAEDCGWTFAMLSALLAGMWPGVNPAPAAAAVLAKPDYAHMNLTLERDFARAVTALFASLTPAAA